MLLGRLGDWVKGRAADGITSVSLPLGHRADDGASGFEAGQVYLEIRVRQLWLTNERELWREYVPVGAVVAEFLHQGRMVAVPTILSASELTGKLHLVGAHDAIEIRDLRVAGPFPYEGDEVRLLVALFRVASKDWLARSLVVLERVGSAVAAGGLTALLPVADSLVQGVTDLLTSSGPELRVGQYRSWSTPSEVGGGDGVLRPMHYALIRRPAADVAAEPFSVEDGRLCTTDGTRTAPFTSHDFVLISIESRRYREDLKRLPFYRRWQETQNHVVHGDLESAERSFRRTVGAIYCDDLTEAQQRVLHETYRTKFQELVLRMGELSDMRPRSGGDAELTPLLDHQDPEEHLRKALG